MSKPHLTGKIVRLFVVFAVLVLLAVGIIAYQSGKSSLKVAAISELVAVAVEKEAALDTWSIERRSDLIHLQQDSVLTSQAAALLAAPSESREEQAAHALVVETLRSRMSGPGTDYLELSVLHPVIGTVIASTKQQSGGETAVDQAYFVNGRLNLYIQGPKTSPDFPGGVITAGIPLRSIDGTLVAVLCARLDFQAMGAIVRPWTGLHRTEDAYLVNDEGYLLTHRRFMHETAVLRQKVDTDAASRCVAGENGVITTSDKRGISVVTVYRWLANQKAGLLIEVDEAEVLAPLRSLALSILAVGIVVAIAATGLAVLLARSITRPLRHLSKEVSGFARAQSDQGVPSSDGDELEILENAFRQMARRVDERTEALAETNRELHAARQAIELANRTRNELIANLTHGIQTPLEAVVGMTDRLLEGPMTQDQRAVAETIQVSSSAVRGVVNDIADFSLIEEGAIEIEAEEFRLLDLLERTVGLLSATATSKGIQLKISVDDGAPKDLRGDARRLRQVLMNLLGNAVKFTTRGCVTVRVSLIDEAAEAVILRFDVSDTGPGLLLEAKHWLSRRLSERAPMKAKEFGGAGMGLPICKNLVTKMSGEMGVESAHGLGSTFWFTVKFSRPEKNARAVLEASDEGNDSDTKPKVKSACSVTSDGQDQFWQRNSQDSMNTGGRK